MGLFWISKEELHSCIQVLQGCKGSDVQNVSACMTRLNSVLKSSSFSYNLLHQTEKLLKAGNAQRAVALWKACKPRPTTIGMTVLIGVIVVFGMLILLGPRFY